MSGFLDQSNIQMKDVCILIGRGIGRDEGWGSYVLCQNPYPYINKPVEI